MICNNCGAEIEEGMKFCGECGEAVPQVKFCVSCGAEIAIRMKFCPECGANQNTGAKAGKTGTIKAEMSLGDKNVIGGSVIGKKEETNISGNATIVKNEDQTKQVKRCHICGSNVSILNGFDCPECGQFICRNCYDEEENCCIDCKEKKVEKKINSYKETLSKFLEDGRIDQTERKKLNNLQNKLGLTIEKANQLEEEIRNCLSNKNELTTFEKMNVKKATELFYNEEKINEAINLLKPIYQSHKTEEEVLNIYLPVLAEASPEEALKEINGLQIDILMAFVTSVGIYIKQKNLIEAEKKLKLALKIWNNNLLLKSYNVLFNIAMYRQFEDSTFLKQAKYIAENLGEAKTKLELSYQMKIQEIIKKETEEAFTEYDKSACEQYGLYYFIMSNNPLLLREESIEEKKEKEILENEKGYVLEELKEVEEEYHNPQIQFYIANRYYDRKDYKNSFIWATKAAEQGNVPAQSMLGKMYDEGLGVQQDYSEAVRWYRLAAEKDDVDAQYNLGYMYENGLGVSPDYEEALKWYIKAAEQGDLGAQYNLGCLYYNGEGVSQDYEQAIEWFIKAAEQDDVDAQYNLGYMYENGLGVSQDYEEALKWYKEAAEQGQVDAQCNLGNMYFNGQGVKQDYKEAEKWLTKAATQGNIDAQNTLDYIKKQNNAKPNFKDCEIHDNSNNDIESELCDFGNIFTPDVFGKIDLDLGLDLDIFKKK